MANLKWKGYVVAINQSGTTAPVPIILFNTIGNIVWSRVSSGIYQMTLVNAFPADRTFSYGCNFWSTFSNTFIILTCRRLDINTCQIQGRKVIPATNMQDNDLTNCYFKLYTYY